MTTVIDYGKLIGEARTKLQDVAGEREGLERKIKEKLGLASNSTIDPSTVKKYNIKLADTYDAETAEAMALAQILTEEARAATVKSSAAAANAAATLEAKRKEEILRQEAAAREAKRKQDEADREAKRQLEVARKQAEDAKSGANKKVNESSEEEFDDYLAEQQEALLDAQRKKEEAAKKLGTSVKQEDQSSERNELNQLLDDGSTFQPPKVPASTTVESRGGTQRVATVDDKSDSEASDGGSSKSTRLPRDTRTALEAKFTVLRNLGKSIDYSASNLDDVTAVQGMKEYEKEFVALRSILTGAIGKVGILPKDIQEEYEKTIKTRAALVASVNQISGTQVALPEVPPLLGGGGGGGGGGTAAPATTRVSSSGSTTSTGLGAPAPGPKKPAPQSAQVVSTSVPAPKNKPAAVKQGKPAEGMPALLNQADANEYSYVEPLKLSEDQLKAAVKELDLKDSRKVDLMKIGTGSNVVYVLLETDSAPETNEPGREEREAVILSDDATKKPLISKYDGAPLIYARFRHDDDNTKAPNAILGASNAAKKIYYMLVKGDIANGKPFASGWRKFFEDNNGFKDKKVKVAAGNYQGVDLVSLGTIGSRILTNIGVEVYPAALAIRSKTTTVEKIGSSIDLITFGSATTSSVAAQPEASIGAALVSKNELGPDWD